MAATLSESKIDRMHFRLPKAVKERVEKAAIASGQTLTDFAVSVLADSADRVLEQEYVTSLSDRDRDRLLRLLDSDGKPNRALKQAQKIHKKLIVE